MALLQINNLSIRFGGLVALEAFDFGVDAGQLAALIGPNGAGKTTAFNLATGMYAPSSGEIRLEDRRIDGLAPAAISRLGIARTFQNIRLFGNLTVLDNVVVALDHLTGQGLVPTLLRAPRFHRERRRLRVKGLELLETFGLAEQGQRLAKTLPYGDQRRLEIARALATNPKVLLLDEPAAGMNPPEKLRLMELIRFIRDRFGLGIWLIEHDMRLVMSICDRVTVLDHGQTIAVGPPAQVQSDPKVIEAYLGQPA